MDGRLKWMSGFVLASGLLTLPAARVLGDSAIEAGSAVLAELALEETGIQLTLRLRERDWPMLRERLTGRMPAIESCSELCVSAGLIGLTGGSADEPLDRPETAEPMGATGAGDDARLAIRFRYRWPDRRERLGVKPLAAGVDIGLLALQEGIPISDLARLDRPVRLELDWQDPWRSRFADTDWRRRHLEPRSYLYVEGDAVRHELVQPLNTLPNALAPPMTEANDRAAVKTRIADYLARTHALTINGAPVTPAMGQVEFVRQSLQGIEPVPLDAPVPRRSAMLGLAMVYEVAAPARELRLDWRSFGPGEETHPVQVIYGQEAMDLDVTPARPSLDWSVAEVMAEPASRSDALPPASAGLSASLLEGLLLNAYRAFAIRGEEAAYDRFAQSLLPPLLDVVYLDQRRALLALDRGQGGESRVRRVEMTAYRLLEDTLGAARVDAGWIAHGVVSHWGHAHERHHRYRAVVHLRREPEGPWKIHALEFVEGRRLENL